MASDVKPFAESSFFADESYEQIEKGHMPSAHNGSRQDVDRDEIDKLE